LKLFLSTACLLLSVATFVFSADTIDPPPSADKLLQDVVTQLPSDPIIVSGNLLVRRRRGVPVANYSFELKANWGAHPPRATYRIDDNFGQTLEQLTIIHGPQKSYQYSIGNPLQPAKLANLSAQIQKTDLTWTDLTLSFLWWTGGEIIGEESIRTFDCYIIKVNAPENSDSTYSSVKIWISKKSHLMLKADGYNANNKLERRLWIKSCKKINEQWMIKDMEIQQYPKQQITKLRVLNIDSTTNKVETAKLQSTASATKLQVQAPLQPEDPQARSACFTATPQARSACFTAAPQARSASSTTPANGPRKTVLQDGLSPQAATLSISSISHGYAAL